MIGVTLRI